MKTRLFGLLLTTLVAAPVFAAEKYENTVNTFRNAGQSSKYFENAYGWAVVPTIGKGGAGIGGAHGDGRVYEHGKLVGTTKMTQLSVGAQLGGEFYSEIVFFQDKRAFDEFTSGNFEFSAQASATAITASAGAEGSTDAGITGDASASKKHAVTAGGWHKGMAVFTVAKGGLMYEAVIAGQKFSYEPK